MPCVGICVGVEGIAKPGRYRLDLPEEYVPLGYREPPTVEELATDFFTGDETGVWAPFEIVSAGPARKRGKKDKQKEEIFDRFAAYLSDSVEESPVYVPGGVAFAGVGNPAYVNDVAEVVLQIRCDRLETETGERDFLDRAYDVVVEGEQAAGVEELTPHVAGKERDLLRTMVEKIENLDEPRFTLSNALYDKTMVEEEFPAPVRQHRDRLNGGKGNLLEFDLLERLEQAAEQVNEERGEIAATVIPKGWLWEKRNGFDEQEINMKDDGYKPVGDLDVSLLTADYDAFQSVLDYIDTEEVLPNGLAMDKNESTRTTAETYIPDERRETV